MAHSTFEGKLHLMFLNGKNLLPYAPCKAEPVIRKVAVALTVRLLNCRPLDL